MNKKGYMDMKINHNFLELYLFIINKSKPTDVDVYKLRRL